MRREEPLFDADRTVIPSRSETVFLSAFQPNPRRAERVVEGFFPTPGNEAQNPEDPAIECPRNPRGDQAGRADFAARRVRAEGLA